MNFFISDAMAQAGGAAQQATPIQPLIMMGLLFVVFYFLLIRPQQKRNKELKQMIANLAKGDEVVTVGGVLGKVKDIDENFISLEVAKGIEMKVQKASVHAMMPKGTVK